MSGLCIYHGGCTDGVAAAWAVWRRNPDWTFYPGTYQKEPPMELVEGSDSVVFVDFSYKQDVMQEVIDHTDGPVTVLDHHKTAQADLEPLLAKNSLLGEFDMERCGAVMAWDYFNGGPRPKLLAAIDAQDRWLPSRDAALIISLRSRAHYPENGDWREFFMMWDHFMTDQGYAELKTDGDAMYRYYRQRVDETKPHASLMFIGGLIVPAVNAPYYLASDVAGELAQEHENGVGVVWWRNKDGSVTFSLRSRGFVDVSDIAARKGGGGHAGAAGFRVDSLADVAAMDWNA